LRVAFLGDQGLGTAAREVLQLVKRERAALVVHAGDLSYGMAPPSAWDAMISEALGADFPYLVAAGNHDLDDWYGPAGFAALLSARLARTPQLRCEGELGLSSVCRFRGLELLISGVGTAGTDHEGFLERSLSRPGPTFRTCVWHKNQHDLQVGTKLDEVGWAAYEICARHGAAIITGHEHSYARTLTLTAIGDRGRSYGAMGDPGRVELGPNRTFVVVTGLGGHSTRERSADHMDDRWWASIYANNFQMQNGKATGRQPLIAFGALFIDFHVGDDPRRAHAYFKTTRDEVVDRFEIEAPAPRSVQQRGAQGP
jgi:3',5'-cyclic AMP phosphodiesterase CpdA